MKENNRTNNNFIKNKKKRMKTKKTIKFNVNLTKNGIIGQKKELQEKKENENLTK